MRLLRAWAFFMSGTHINTLTDGLSAEDLLRPRCKHYRMATAGSLPSSVPHCSHPWPPRQGLRHGRMCTFGTRGIPPETCQDGQECQDARQWCVLHDAQHRMCILPCILYPPRYKAPWRSPRRCSQPQQSTQRSAAGTRGFRNNQTSVAGLTITLGPAVTGWFTDPCGHTHPSRLSPTYDDRSSTALRCVVHPATARLHTRLQKHRCPWPQ